MMKHMIKQALVMVVIVFGFVSVVQFAAGPTASAALFNSAKQDACSGTQLTGSGACDATAADKINSIITTVVNILSIIVGIAAVVMIIIGGFRLVTSGGDPNTVSSARKGILYALVGLVVVAFAQFMVKFVLNRVT